MPALRITEDEIRAAVTAVYYDGKHAPRMIWVDHWDDDWSYVRAQYPAEFCKHCARRLLRVVRAIKDTSGNEPTVTICIYMGSSDELADERSAFLKNRLSGFSP